MEELSKMLKGEHLSEKTQFEIFGLMPHKYIQKAISEVLLCV